MSQEEPPESGPDASAVPTGRMNRFFRLGATATQMAASGAAERARRLMKKAEEELPHALLTADNARLLAARLSKLRGAAMKVGQMLSLEGDSMLPQEFAQALEVLRSSAHRMPEEQVRAVLKKEYGRDWHSRFREVDLHPIASASIGQVHRAVTHEGEELVLKIQYPGVSDSIESDVDNLRSLLAMTRLVSSDIDLDALTREVKAELRREVDYEHELTNLLQYREALAGDRRFLLPRGFAEHSTKRVLAMERVPGVALLSWAQTASQEERNRIALLLLELLLNELFAFGLSQTDPNPGNYFYDAATGCVVLLDFGATRAVPEHVAEMYKKATFAMVHRDREQIDAVLREMGVHEQEGGQLASILTDISLEVGEVFEDRIYDFGATDLQKRVKASSRKLMAYRRDLRPPQAEYMFFQRKLSGMFLLCRQLGAQINLRPLLDDAGLLCSR